MAVDPKEAEEANPGKNFTVLALGAAKAQLNTLLVMTKDGVGDCTAVGEKEEGEATEKTNACVVVEGLLQYSAAAEAK